MWHKLAHAMRRWAEKDGRGYPDWAMRYLPVVRRFRPYIDANTRILEIGANENGFARFVGQPVVAVDISLAHLKAARKVQPVMPVVADMAELPFRDDTFSVCVCMDSYEHISPETRAAASREIVRVISPQGRAVVTFPTGAAAIAAESQVRESYEKLTGQHIHWLEEHVVAGLPDAEKIRKGFCELLSESHHVSITGNCPVGVWIWMWKVLMCNWPGRANAVFQVLLRVLTPLLSHWHRGVCYRAMVWVESFEKRENDS